MFAALDDCREVVARQLTELAGEHRRAVGEQDLRLAVAAGVKQNLAGGRVTRRVLKADAELEVAERNPRRLTAPARLDQLALERQDALEGGAFQVGQHVVHPQVVETHAVDDGLGGGQAEQAGLGIAGLGPGRHRAHLDEAEAELGKGVDGLAVLVQAGGQADAVGKFQAHHLRRPGGGHLAGDGQVQRPRGAQGGEGQVVGGFEMPFRRIRILIFCCPNQEKPFQVMPFTFLLILLLKQEELCILKIFSSQKISGIKE